MRNSTIVLCKVVCASVLMLAACGRASESTSSGDEFLGISVVNPAAGPITDTTVRLTCKLIGQTVNDTTTVDYTFGVADANGVAQEPIQHVESGAGFVDITGLTPDTTYAVSFIATIDGQHGTFAPTITFHTMQPLDPNESFGLRVIPGQYAAPTGNNSDWLTLVQVSDPSCASGIGLVGSLGGFDWRCVDFTHMTATRQTSAGSASWTLNFCGCDELVADYGTGVQASCAAHATAAAGCATTGGTSYEFTISGSEEFNGVTTKGIFGKTPR
jgi:hypothetical protein